MVKTILSVAVVALIIMAVAVPVISTGSGTKGETGENAYECRQSVITKVGESFTFQVVDGKLEFSRDGKVTYRAEIGEMIPLMRVQSYIPVTLLSADTVQIWSNTYTSDAVFTATRTESGMSLTSDKGLENSTRSTYVTYPDVDGSLAYLSGTDPWINVGQACYIQFSCTAYISNKWTNISGSGYTGSWDGATMDIAVATIDGTATTEIAAENGEAKQLGGITSTKSTIKDIAITYVVAPVEYIIVEGSGGEDSTVNTMVDLIPMLMMAGLMIAAVAAYIQFRGV